MHKPKEHLNPNVFRIQITTASALLSGMLLLGGCERGAPPAVEQTPAAAPQAPVENLLSNVPVQGDEPLPSGHPTLPGAMPCNCICCITCPPTPATSRR
jgi:hypothetical protein